MLTKPFVIYKSSAGSGKTYTLALEYLKLALEHPSAFRQILAVTFTNKATKEMKERILHVLERLIHEVNPEESLDSSLMEHLDLTPDGLKTRAREVLSAMLHRYSDFSVSTIDSFFQRVVRAFAREMDLQAKFDIELDQGAVLERLVDRLMYRVAEDTSLHRWLVDFADEKIREGKSWDIRWNINKLGSQIFQEDFKKHQHTIREFLKDPENILEFRSRLFEGRKRIRKQVQRIKKEAEAIKDQCGLSWTDFKGGSKSALLFFERLDKGKDLFPNISATLSSCPDHPENWYIKKGPVAKIEQAYNMGLNELLKEALALVPRWNTLEAVRKNFFVFGIFSKLLEELQQIKEEENIMLISDANEFLKEITAETEAPFIYEKVGNQYKHYLIDEFQDTSGFQWASFYPLLDNTLASGNKSLIVGDVKQSIYRWRGGDLTLLLHEVEQQIGPGRVEVKDLNINYRSLPNVVEFNNALFEKLASTMMAAAKQKFGVEDHLLAAIKDAYCHVRQQVSPKKQAAAYKGKVKVEFLKKEKEEKISELAAARLPEMVKTLQDKGFRLRDIAVLVRSNMEGQLVAETLMEYERTHQGDGYRYDVLSGEAMFLHKAASVQCLIATLRYLLHPDDEMSARAIWYHRERLKSGTADHELFDKATIPERIEKVVGAFEERRDVLDQLPLVELVEELAEIFGFNRFGAERAYISGFKEAVFDYVSKNKSDVGGFLEWWELKRMTRTVKIPESHDAIRVLTIHKSKGLQFKAVLMPFMDWEIVGSKDVIWSPYEESNSSQLIVPLSMTAALAQTSFAERYRTEVMLAYLDSLNMIYVALTRAEEVIWTLGEAYLSKGKADGCLNKLSYTVQTAIQSAVGADDLLNLNDHYDKEAGVLELGEWPEEKQAEAELFSIPELSWSYRNWTYLLQVKEYSGSLSQEKVALQAKRGYGVLIHKILERLKNVHQLEGLLMEAYFDGQVNRKEMEEVKLLIEKLFEAEEMKEWFSENVRVMTEQGIILPGGSGKRPDRIIVKEEQTVVVDFKTGEKKAAHQKQVIEYITLMESLVPQPAEGYLVYIETGEILKVEKNGSKGR